MNKNYPNYLTKKLWSDCDAPPSEHKLAGDMRRVRNPSDIIQKGAAGTTTGHWSVCSETNKDLGFLCSFNVDFQWSEMSFGTRGMRTWATSRVL